MVALPKEAQGAGRRKERLLRRAEERPASPLSSVSLPNDTPPDDTSPHSQEALDMVAQILRVLGRQAFAMEGEDLQAFSAQCEAWAQHVLTGATAGTVLDRAVILPEDGRRGWGDVGRFVRNRRRQEVTFVNKHLSELKTVIWDFVGGLRTLAGTERTTEASIQQSLMSLEVAVKSDSLTTMRSALGPALYNIREALKTQRARFDEQLQEMSARVQNLRDDLLETKRRAAQDPLTQLYHRGAFDATLGRSIDLAGLTGQPLALVLIDLDHFKAVNDGYGHPAGDVVLKAAADTIVRAFPRRNDFVARYGGEEFAVLIFDAPEKDLPRLVEGMLDRFRALRVSYEDAILQVTCSAGYACLRNEETPQALVTRADAALYRAKEGGRDRAEVG